MINISVYHIVTGIAKLYLSFYGVDIAGHRTRVLIICVIQITPRPGSYSRC